MKSITRVIVFLVFVAVLMTFAGVGYGPFCPAARAAISSNTTAGNHTGRHVTGDGEWSTGISTGYAYNFRPATTVGTPAVPGVIYVVDKGTDYGSYVSDNSSGAFTLNRDNSPDYAGTVYFQNTQNANTFRGTLTINAGTLKFGTGTTNNVDASIVINSGGTLDLTEGSLKTTGSSSMTVTVNTGGTLLAANFMGGSTGSLGDLYGRTGKRILDGGTIEITGDSHDSDKGFTVTAAGGTFKYDREGETINFAVASGNIDNNAVEVKGLFKIGGDGNISFSDSGATSNVAMKITGTSGGTIEKFGGGTLTIDSNLSGFTGSIRVTGGDMVVNSGIYGSGTITVDGGNLTLAGNNPFTGTFSVANGVLDMTASTAKISAGKVTVLSGGTLKLLSYINGGSLGGLLGDAGNRVLQGGTIEVVGGTESGDKAFTVATGYTSSFLYNPATSPENNTLYFHKNGSRAILVNGNLNFGGTGNITLGNASGDAGLLLTGGGNINKVGGGTLTLATNNPNFSGIFTISAGKLTVSDVAQLGTGSRVVLNGGKFDMDYTGEFGKAVEVTANSGLVLSGDMTFTGAVTGDAAAVLSVTSAVTPTLTFQDNVSLGGLDVQSGSIAFSGTATTQAVKIGNLTSTANDVAFSVAAGNTTQFAGKIAGNVATAGDGTLQMQGHITGNLDIGADMTFSPGNDGVGFLNVGGNLDMGDRTTLELNVAGGVQTNGLFVTGAINLADDSAIEVLLADAAEEISSIFLMQGLSVNKTDQQLRDMLTIGGVSPSEYWGHENWDIVTVPVGASGIALFASEHDVPEPTTWMMLFVGAAGVFLLRKRRR